MLRRRKRLGIAPESPASGARFVGRVFGIVTDVAHCKFFLFMVMSLIASILYLTFCIIKKTSSRNTEYRRNAPLATNGGIAIENRRNTS